ncbi:CPBP family intramembrane glutamic endopeptidase [Saccharopolyspora sp. NPDC050389]|uniref:CPBP family intramembrane glutamic endopeptidase n=1 Tax=Saccharopolyspora sp. NPDC050389 TaxID=3155516 RepID=UPI00340C1FF7
MTTSQLDRPTTQPASSRFKGVVAFVLLAYGIAWASMFGAALLGFSLVDPLAQLPFGFAPAIAAIIVRRWVTREGFGDAGLKLRLRANWHLYLVAWLGPFAMVAAALGIAALAGLWQPSAAALPEWSLILALVFLVPVLTPIYWGEEFGWIGYLRLRMFPGRPLAATLATAVIWAVWHYPLAFLGYIEFDDVALGLLVWTTSFACQEIVLSWLWVRSGSIWPVSLAHAGNNMVLALLTGMVLTEGAGLGVNTVTVLTACPIAAAALWVLASGRLRSTRP